MSGSARSGLRKSSARIELEVSEHTLSLVDRARGEFSRGEWIRDAIGAQLSGKRGHLADVTMPSTAPERPCCPKYDAASNRVWCGEHCRDYSECGHARRIADELNTAEQSSKDQQ
jgi:hypothetical protein